MEQQTLALERLGLAHVYMGQGKQGMRYLEEGLSIAQTLAQREPNSSLPSFLLTALADAWSWQNRYRQALPYLEARLEFCRQREDSFYHVETLRLLGRCAFALKDIDTSIDWFQQALALAENLHLFRVVAIVSNDLGVVYAYGLGEISTSMSLFVRAVELFQAQNNWGALPVPMAHLAYCYAASKQFEQAKIYAQQAFDIVHDQQKLVTKGTKAVVLACLAKASWTQRHYAWALWLIGRSFVVSPPWENVNGMLILRNFLKHFKIWG